MLASHASAPAAKPLRIVFAMRNYWYVRHFEAVIRLLAARGHTIHLLAERAPNEQARDWSELAEAVAATVPAVTYETAPRSLFDPWYDLRLMLRLTLDYIRFTRPEYRPLSQLVERARQRTPRGLRRIADLAGRSNLTRRLLERVLRPAERAIPPDDALATTVASSSPDLVIVTPLVELGSEQIDVMRVAQRNGIPTAFCVGSWDHLSSKGMVRARPTRVFVWNERQRREAVEMHGIDGDRVEVTGAQCFDEWFDRRPALDRDRFCRKVGLDPAVPFVAYVCSALFEGSPSEAAFVQSWVRAIRENGSQELRRLGILVRPHPKRGFEWDGVELTQLTNVAFWPPQAGPPSDAATKADYFDTLFHAAAVVGLNTSALIEAGIVGRPVHTILLPQFAGSQTGTIHFRYLLDGGLLRVARSLEEHVPQLAASLQASDGEHNAAFVREFVRPHGLGEPAAPRLVASLESVASLPVGAAAPSPSERVLRLALRPIAALTAGRFSDHVARERRRHLQAAARAAERARVVARREQIRRERMEAKNRQREAERLAREAEREAERQRREAERLRQQQARLAAIDAKRQRQEADRRAKEQEQRDKEERKRIRFEAHRAAKEREREREPSR